jgi:hypothetical protein
LLLLALVTQGIPLLWGSFQTIQDVFAAGFASLMLRLVLVMMLGAIGSAASTFVVSETYLGRSLTMSDALRRALPFIGRILLTGVSIGLLGMLGFICLIVPGFIVVCGFLLATPALVLEGLPSANAALARSWKLTTGLRGRIFVILFVGALLIYLPLMAVSALSAAVTGGGDVGTMSVIFALVSSLLQLVVYPFFYVATVVLYYDAKVRKEGFDLELLAQTLLPA